MWSRLVYRKKALCWLSPKERFDHTPAQGAKANSFTTDLLRKGVGSSRSRLNMITHYTEDIFTSVDQGNGTGKHTHQSATISNPSVTPQQCFLYRTAKCYSGWRKCGVILLVESPICPAAWLPEHCPQQCWQCLFSSFRACLKDPSHKSPPGTSGSLLTNGHDTNSSANEKNLNTFYNTSWRGWIAETF